MRLRNIVIFSLGLALPWSLAAQVRPASHAPADNSKKPLKLRVSQGVAEGLVLHKVPPHYPEEAKEKHITGDVILGVTIDHSGNVSELKAISGDPLLARAAAEAVKQWKYKPYLLNGEPVEIETTVRISFRM
ncbi:MAG TPA: energy transducer TonB [Candidatus Angelobacter sp.]|nr:energy transducer TonB [Candidatus Angelobacter sp.]